MNKYEEAKPLCEEVYERRNKNCGPENSDTVSSLFGLAVLHEKMGNLSEAIELHRRCLAIRRVQKGENNPETLTSMHSVAMLQAKIDGMAAAQPLLEECLKRRRLVLGDDSEYTRSTKIALSEIKQELS